MGRGRDIRSPGELDWPELTGSRFSEGLCFFKLSGDWERQLDINFIRRIHAHFLHIHMPDKAKLLMFGFKAKSYYVAQFGLKLKIFLTPASQVLES